MRALLDVGVLKSEITQHLKDIQSSNYIVSNDSINNFSPIKHMKNNFTILGCSGCRKLKIIYDVERNLISTPNISVDDNKNLSVIFCMDEVNE